MALDEIVILSDASDDDIAIVGSTSAFTKRPSPVTKSATMVLDPLDSDSDDDDDDDLAAALANAKAPPREWSGSGSATARKTSMSMSMTGSPRTGRKASSSRSILDDSLSVREKRRRSGSESESEESAADRKRILAEKKRKEREADKAAKEASKEAERAAKKREREEAAAAKEAVKARKQREREEAKAEREAAKSYEAKVKDVNRLRISKIEAMRDIEVHMAHDLSLPTSPIAGALPEIKARIQDSQSKIVFLSEKDTIIESTIRFRRYVKSRWDEEAKRFTPIDNPFYQWEKTTVLVTSVDAVVDQIAEDEDLFIRWLKDVRLTMSIKDDEQVFLLVRGMAKYHSKTVSVVNKSFRETATAGLMGGGGGGVGGSQRSRAGSNHPKNVTKDMVEAELLRAQVAERIFVVLADTTMDIEDWLFNLAGDVALCPYKRLEASHLSFAAPDGQKKAQDATEMLGYMLQEVPGVTQAGAAGIVESFPTFRELMQAYEDAERSGRAAALIEGSAIGQRVDGAASSRRIGKVTSKKVFDVLRCNDPLALF